MLIRNIARLDLENNIQYGLEGKNNQNSHKHRYEHKPIYFSIVNFLRNHQTIQVKANGIPDRFKTQNRIFQRPFFNVIFFLTVINEISKLISITDIFIR